MGCSYQHLKRSVVDLCLTRGIIYCAIAVAITPTDSSERIMVSWIEDCDGVHGSSSYPISRVCQVTDVSDLEHPVPDVETNAVGRRH